MSGPIDPIHSKRSVNVVSGPPPDIADRDRHHLKVLLELDVYLGARDDYRAPLGADVFRPML
ncbi:MAG: hypothetical protein JWM24_205 [Solirubrobacterales bacterium]|nr:hypothetical protein [Solirubrobacterales bacterium]